MSTLNNSTISSAPDLDHMTWIKVSEKKSEEELMDMYQSEEISEIFMMIYQESQTLARNVRYVWKLLTDLLITINFNLMDEMAAK